MPGWPSPPATGTLGNSSPDAYHPHSQDNRSASSSSWPSPPPSASSFPTPPSSSHNHHPPGSASPVRRKPLPKRHASLVNASRLSGPALASPITPIDTAASTPITAITAAATSSAAKTSPNPPREATKALSSAPVIRSNLPASHAYTLSSGSSVYEEDFSHFVPKDLDRYDNVGLRLHSRASSGLPPRIPLKQSSAFAFFCFFSFLRSSSEMQTQVRCPPPDAIELTSCFNCSSPDPLEVAPPLPLFG
jgi:hypothetical protein